MLRLVLCSTSLLAVLAPLVRAEHYEFRTGLPVPVLLTKKASVQLVTLVVDAVVERGPLPFGSAAWDDRDRVTYDMHLVLGNLANAPTAFDVGIPLPDAFLGRGEKDEPDAGDLVARFGLIARDPGRTHHMRLVPHRSGPGQTRALAWSMVLGPGEKRELRVHGRLPVSVSRGRATKTDRPAPRAWLHELEEALVERTGVDMAAARTWAGDVESVRVVFRSGPFSAHLRRRGWTEVAEDEEPVRRPLVHARFDPPGYAVEDGVVTWSWSGCPPEPRVALAWWITRIPRAPGDVASLVAHLFGEEAAREDLEELREVLLASHGVVPRSDRIRSFVENQIWYASRPGRKASDLGGDARAVLATLEGLIAKSKPRGRLTADHVPDPRIELPKADLAKPLEPAQLEKMLVIRLTRRGFLPALHVGLDEIVRVRDVWSFKGRCLQSLADRDREEQDPKASRLDVLIFADRRTPWARIVRVVQVCNDPDVRVWRTWLAARDHRGRLAAFPIFGAKDRGLARPNPRPVLRRHVRLNAERGPGGFDGTDLLYRWSHQVWRGRGDLPVHIDLHVTPRVPLESALGALAEIRRFGFACDILVPESTFAWKDGPDAPDSRKAWFHVGDTVPEIAGEIPPRRLGVQVVKDPTTIVGCGIEEDPPARDGIGR